MNRKAFIGIVLLMGTCLLGNIFLQVYWIRDAVRVKEEQFNRSVHEALNAVVISLETQEATRLITTRFPVMLPLVDSLPALPSAIHPGSVPVLDVVAPAMHFSQALAPNHPIHEILMDSLRNRHRLQIPRTEFDSIQVFSRDNHSLVWQKVEIKRDQLQGVMGQIAVQSVSNEMPIEERITREALDSLLRHELKSRGIHLAFEYGTISSRGNPLPSLSSSGFDQLAIAQAYLSSFFPHDIFPKPDRLAVYFPGKQTYVFRSLTWSVVAAVFFTLIILATFYITIQMMIRQKKISDIKTDFINNMSHEFKTPIATISLAADSINNPKVLSNPDRIRHYTAVIKEENSRMNVQVENVLQMALLDRNALELKFEPLNVHDLIAKVTENMRLQAMHYQGNLHCQLEAVNPYITGDRIHLVNVITNLIDNAIKYSPEGPDIVIHTTNSLSSFSLTVTDKGMGMDRETQQKIFDKFYRVNTGNIHTVKGFGLGLSYVKAIVFAHQGEVTVWSEPGKGSIFKLVFPSKSI